MSASVGRRLIDEGYLLATAGYIARDRLPLRCDERIDVLEEVFVFDRNL